MKSLYLLLLCTYSSLAFSLGLGDIELKSHLNETLNAKISLSDTDGALDQSCFTATDASDVQAFKKAYVTLKKSNGVSQISITTYDVIYEPIVNLLVTFHCDPQIKREYVLLMDPAPITTPEALANTDKPAAANTTSERVANVAPKPKHKAHKPDTNAQTVSTAAANTDIPAEKPKKKRKKSVATSVDQKLAEAYTGKAATATTPATPAGSYTETSPPAKTADKPLLVISGGNDSANGQPNLSLRMETQLDLARTETAPVTSNTDAADEVTVMTNRLAHLEKQLLSLQAKNTQLQAENERIKSEGFHLSPEIMEWVHRLLIGLGIIGIIGIAELLRRKIMLNRLQQDEAVWFDASGAEEPEELPDAKSASASIFNDSVFNEPNFGQKNEFANQASLIQSENDEVENVLDHADVFMAHGRTALAIQLLQNHLEEAPTESPAIWLKLMSLLAKEGSEEEYERTVRECNHFFNIKMPSFADALKPDDSTIEEHPHIVTRLEGVWGSQYAVGFLNDLIYNQQSQPREGFERGTFEELFFLKQIANILQSSGGLQSNGASAQPNTYGPAAYKPEVVKSNIENTEVNKEVFAAAGGAAAATLFAAGDADALDNDISENARDSDSSLSNTELLSETYKSEPEPVVPTPTPAKSANAFTDDIDSGFTVEEIEDPDNPDTPLNTPDYGADSVIEFDTPSQATSYEEIDMDLSEVNSTDTNLANATPRIEKAVTEPDTNTLNFEEIDFDLSTSDTAQETLIPEALDDEAILEPGKSKKQLAKAKTATTSVTDFEVEESDADIIRKYLSQAEERAKKKAEDETKSEKDSNLIEFDWDLPKLDKE